MAMSLNNLAALYKNQGRYAEAEPLYKRALAIYEKKLGPDHPDTGISLNNLAGLYKNQGRYAEAEPLYKRALAIDEKKLGPDHPDTATSLNNLAGLYDGQGRYAEAEPLYKRALAIKEKKLGPEHPSTATSLNNLANLYYSQSRYAEAEPLYKRALAIDEKKLGPDHPSTATSLNNLALLYDGQGRYVDALASMRRATGIARRRLVGAGNRETEGLKSERRGYRNHFIFHTDLVLHPDQKGERGALEGEAFEVLQLGRSSSAAAALARMAARFGAGSSAAAAMVRRQQDTRARYGALDKKLIKAISRPQEKQNRTLLANLRREIKTAKTQIETLEKEIRVKFPGYAALTGRDPLSLPDTQGLLKDDEALVTFAGSWEGDKTHVFVVWKNSRRVYTVDLALKEMRELVQRIRTGVDPVKPFDVEAAHDLYRRLLGLADAPFKGMRHLIVVPGGSLTSIPFSLLATEPHVTLSRVGGQATLQTKGIKPYTGPPKTEPSGVLDYTSVPWLARKYAITTLPSVASLKSLRSSARKSQAKKPFIGFGDPILSARKGPVKGVDMVALFRGGIADVNEIRKLHSLTGTSDELREIAKYLGAGDGALYLRERATESMVKKIKLDKSRVIAFSTHGLLPAETGKLGSVVEPALVMTPPETATREDDGLLTASEIAQLKMDADFVILSACNTAAGEKAGGESLSGLAKAFFYAGTRSLLVSHWPVASKAATQLTTKMFKSLKDNPSLPRAEAFRRSMMSLASAPETSHPFYWAPFSVVGD